MRNRKVDSVVLEKQREEGQFNEARFALRAGFAGEYEVVEVSDLKRRGEDEAYSHQIITRSKLGSSALHGSMVAKAILVKDASELSKLKTVKDGVKNVWYVEDVVPMMGKLFHHVFEFDAKGRALDFEYPEKMEILGAYVFRSKEGDHPQVAMNKYPMMSLLVKHHKERSESYLTWDDARRYVAATGKDRPVGLPDDYKLELPSDDAAWDMGNWTYRLIIKDFTV